MEVINTARGSLKILNEGYAYTIKNSGILTVNWECSKRKTAACKGILITDAGLKCIKKQTAHSHPPDKCSIEVMKIRRKMDDEAKLHKCNPQQLISDSLKDLPLNLQIAVGKNAAIKRNIRRIRKKNAPPQQDIMEVVPIERTPKVDFTDNMELIPKLEERIPKVAFTDNMALSPKLEERIPKVALTDNMELITKVEEKIPQVAFTDNMELIHTSQGSLKILNEGYAYTKKRSGTSSVNWECSKRKTAACKGTLVTDTAIKYIKNQTSHSHPPDKGSIEVMKIRRKMNDDAKLHNCNPQQLISDSLKDLPMSLQIAVGKNEAIKRNIRRIRKKTAPPQQDIMEVVPIVEMSEQVSWGVCWAVVTGASRGFGAEICVSYARIMAPGSCIVGVARSAQGLADTAKKVKEANLDVQFIPVILDLGSAGREDMESALATTLSTLENAALSRVTIVHNAGSLGDLQYVKDLNDHEHTKKYYDFNISSVITLNAIFMDLVKSLPTSVQCQIINISSLCAITPMKSWGLYCAGKAARDMFFKVLATEEPAISVINYSPGPLDGEMQAQVRATSADDEIRTSFTDMKDQGKLLPIHVSVDKMIQVIHANKFKSGDHVDYYDEV